MRQTATLCGSSDSYIKLGLRDMSAMTDAPSTISPERRLSSDLSQLGPIAAIQAVAERMTPPLFWYGPERPAGERVYRNGSAALINTGVATFAVTAAHVFDQYLQDKRSNQDIVCQLGASLFNPEATLIDHDTKVDLATFRIPAVPPSHFVHQPPTTWPPPCPTVGNRLMLGGHAGKYRTEAADRMQGGVVRFFVRASGGGPSSVSCHLGIAEGRPFPGETRIPPGTHLGGISGGVVLLVQESPVLSWCASGVIIEANDPWELVIARPLSLLDEHGRIVRGVV
jgi:hypothetical protein